MYWTTLPVFPLLLTLYLSVNGLKSRKLSPSGAVTAFVVGFAIMSTHVRAVGVSLILFYLLASKATKRKSSHVSSPRRRLDEYAKEGKQRKAQLEAGYHGSGNRTGWQVLCNSLAAFVACVIWSVKFTPDALPWSLLARAVHVPRGPEVYDSNNWCPVSPAIADGLSRALVFVTLGCVCHALCVMYFPTSPLANSLAASETRLPRNWAFCRAHHLSLSRRSRKCLQGRMVGSLSEARSRQPLVDALLGLLNSSVWSWKTPLAEPSGRSCSPR